MIDHYGICFLRFFNRCRFICRFCRLFCRCRCRLCRCLCLRCFCLHSNNGVVCLDPFDDVFTGFCLSCRSRSIYKNAFQCVAFVKTDRKEDFSIYCGSCGGSFCCIFYPYSCAFSNLEGHQIFPLGRFRCRCLCCRSLCLRCFRCRCLCCRGFCLRCFRYRGLCCRGFCLRCFRYRGLCCRSFCLRRFRCRGLCCRGFCLRCFRYRGLCCRSFCLRRFRYRGLCYRSLCLRRFRCRSFCCRLRFSDLRCRCFLDLWRRFFRYRFCHYFFCHGICHGVRRI